MKKQTKEEKLKEGFEELIKELPEKELLEITGRKIIERVGKKESFFKGRSMDSINAAILYLTYRKIKIPRSLDEISIITDVQRKEIGRIFMKLKKLLGLEYCRQSSIMGESCLLISKPSSFIKKIIERLNLSEKVFEDSKKLLEEYDEDSRGRNPQTWAASAVYLAALMNEEKKTQREVADASGITEVAIRNGYAQIIKDKNIEELK